MILHTRSSLALHSKPHFIDSPRAGTQLESVKHVPVLFATSCSASCLLSVRVCAAVGAMAEPGFARPP